MPLDRPYLFAQALRIAQTDAEKKLWTILRSRRLAGFKFRRQQPIDHYIADFCCLSARLIVELDGGQHADQEQYDAERTSYLEKQGFKVLRFWNDQVLKETDSVLEAIYMALTPHPNPLPQGEREPKA